MSPGLMVRFNLLEAHRAHGMSTLRQAQYRGSHGRSENLRCRRLHGSRRVRLSRTPHCPVCGERIARQTPQQIVDQVLAMEEGTKSVSYTHLTLPTTPYV